jgi:hypothetical protein
MSETQFLPTKTAYQVLGYVNSDSLLYAVKSGLLRIGIEVQDRRSPNSQIPRYFFDLNKCVERLQTIPEKRK